MATKPKTAPDPRRVEYVPLSEVMEDPRNPRTHDEAQIGASVGRFGVLDLITMDERTGFIVSGHGRRKTYVTMEERGDSPPEGVKVGKEGEWLVPVVKGWASRSDHEARAALIALNRLTELGGWVDDELIDLLSELNDEESAGLEGIGFTLEQLDELVVRADKEISDLPDGFEPGDLSGKGDSGEDSPGIASYTLIFDDEDQMKAWQGFLRWLAAERREDSETISTLVMGYVAEGDYGSASEA